MYIKERNILTNCFRGDGKMKKLAVLMCVVCMAGLANAAFTWNATGTMVYDGLGVDSALDPKTVTGAETGGDVNIANGAGGIASLTVVSGTLTVDPKSSWGYKVGHMPGSGTPAYDSQGAITVENGATLNWYVNHNNEDRMMFGNNIRNGKCGKAAVTLNGGAFNITGDATFTNGERQVRFGSDGGIGNLVLNAGTMTISVNLPVAFGDKWTNGGTTWNTAAAASVSTMTIDDGSLICSGSNIFGVGNNDVINFLTGGTGKLSIKNWTSTEFGGLIGKLQIDGVAQTDLSKFAVGVDGTQGTLSLVPEPTTLALLGLGAMSLIRRKK
jgi:hypothetical protein